MKLIKFINPENVSEEEVNKYDVREAGRAIVIDDEKNIAILYASKQDYYKLPGGGVEKGEDSIVAIKRECIEEIGCNIEILEEIGSIIEYMKIFKIKQTSYCYFAKVEGKKMKPNYTEEEKRRGFQTLWLPYEEALDKLKSCIDDSTNYHFYVVPRDIAFLEEVRKLIK